MLCDWMTEADGGSDPEDLPRIFGRISFIRQCSESSIEKLKKMIRIKSDRD